MHKRKGRKERRKREERRKMDWFQKQNSLMDMHYVQAIQDLAYTEDNLLVLHALCTETEAPPPPEGEQNRSLARSFICASGRPTKLRSPLWEAARDQVCTWVQTLRAQKVETTAELAPVYAFADEQDMAFRDPAFELVDQFCSIQ